MALRGVRSLSDGVTPRLGKSRSVPSCPTWWSAPGHLSILFESPSDRAGYLSKPLAHRLAACQSVQVSRALTRTTLHSRPEVGCAAHQ